MTSVDEDLERGAARSLLRRPSRTPNRDGADVVVLGDWASQRAASRAVSIRVIVAGHKPLVRAGYLALLANEERITVVGEVASAAEAMRLTPQVQPHILLLDLALSGLESVGDIARMIAYPGLAGVAVMVIGQSGCDERTLAALRAGAVGVLDRQAEPAELIRGVYALARGGAWISAEAIRRLLHDSPRQPPHGCYAEQLTELTDREREIVALVAMGLSNAEIAKRLVISPATAKTHVNRAMIKLGARNRAELVVLAYETGLRQPTDRAACQTTEQERQQ